MSLFGVFKASISRQLPPKCYFVDANLRSDLLELKFLCLSLVYSILEGTREIRVFKHFGCPICQKWLCKTAMDHGEAGRLEIAPRPAREWVSICHDQGRSGFEWRHIDRTTKL